MANSPTRRRRGSARRASGEGGGAPRRVSDLAPYVGYTIAWLFITFLAYLAFPDLWLLIAAGLAALLFVYAAWCTWAAYGGRTLAMWQKGLVRLPLILLGASHTPVNDIRDAPLGRHAGIVATVIAILFLALCAVIAMNG